MYTETLYYKWKKIFGIWFHFVITNEKIYVNGVEIGEYNG